MKTPRGGGSVSKTGIISLNAREGCAMLIVWGSRLYGKVDEVPGLFHVATRFGHLWYIPLIPMGSHLVLARQGDSYQGIPIPMSGKSVLLAWLRAGSLVGGVIAGIVAMVETKSGPDAWMMPAIVSGLLLVLCGFLSFHKLFLRASYDRARRLGEMVGLTDQGRQMIDAAYGFGEGARDPFAQA
jgi:hypothetical protein